jgi:hypothetical protein
MQLLHEICRQYSKWNPLEEYLLRIETYQGSDGALVLENCKSLIESICDKMGCLSNSRDLAKSFVTVAQRLGEFRNQFAVIGHGASVYQLEEHRNKVTKAATDFMISTVEQLAVFLITVYQEEYPLQKQPIIRYEDNPDFNREFDEENEPLQIGFYGPYSPSELLFNIDIDAYRTALSDYLTG